MQQAANLGKLGALGGTGAEIFAAGGRSAAEMGAAEDFKALIGSMKLDFSESGAALQGILNGSVQTLRSREGFLREGYSRRGDSCDEYAREKPGEGVNPGISQARQAQRRDAHHEGPGAARAQKAEPEATYEREVADEGEGIADHLQAAWGTLLPDVRQNFASQKPGVAEGMAEGASKAVDPRLTKLAAALEKQARQGDGDFEVNAGALMARLQQDLKGAGVAAAGQDSAHEPGLGQMWEAAGGMAVRLGGKEAGQAAALAQDLSAFEIGKRVGHGGDKITYRYAHLFPNKQSEMADFLNREWNAAEEKDEGGEANVS